MQFAHQSAIKSRVSARARWHTDKTELIAARILCLRESQFVFKSLGNKSHLWLPHCDCFFATALPSLFHCFFFGRLKPNRTTVGRLKPKQKNMVAFLLPAVGAPFPSACPPTSACRRLMPPEQCNMGKFVPLHDEAFYLY